MSDRAAMGMAEVLSTIYLTESDLQNFWNILFQDNPIYWYSQTDVGNYIEAYLDEVYVTMNKFAKEHTLMVLQQDDWIIQLYSTPFKEEV